MAAQTWRKRCGKCGLPKIIDGRQSVCEDCLRKTNIVTTNALFVLCEVRCWCGVIDCKGELPCRYGNIRHKILNEQIGALSPDIQKELFGRTFNTLP